MKTNRYDCLLQEIRNCKPTRIMEVGTWNGDNAIRMVNEAKRHNLDVKYFGFDLFGTAPESELAKDAPSKSLVWAKLQNADIDFKLVPGDTKVTLELFHATYPMDFIYIDGGHSVETIQSDWDNCKDFMHRYTKVIFDDYYLNREDVGAKKTVTAIKYDPKYVVEPIGEIHSFDTPMGRIDVQMMKVTYA